MNVRGDIPAAISAETVIHIDNVHKTFVVRRKPSPAIAEASLEVHAGAFVSLIGPSGCGKSTLLNLIAGLTQADEGAVVFRGRRVSGPNTDVGYLTQDDALLPWRTVISNVALPLELRGVRKAEREAVAAQMLVRVGLAGFERHHPAQLSGGMRKRVSLARTLVWGTKVLLLDEPFGMLDAQTKLLMQQLLMELAQQLSLTVVLVTHDLAEAIFLSDEIVVISKRPGRILQRIAVHTPRPRDVARRTEEDTVLYERLWDALKAQQQDDA